MGYTFLGSSSLQGVVSLWNPPTRNVKDALWVCRQKLQIKINLANQNSILQFKSKQTLCMKSVLWHLNVSRESVFMAIPVARQTLSWVVQTKHLNATQHMDKHHTKLWYGVCEVMATCLTPLPYFTPASNQRPFNYRTIYLDSFFLALI